MAFGMSLTFIRKRLVQTGLRVINIRLVVAEIRNHMCSTVELIGRKALPCYRLSANQCGCGDIITPQKPLARLYQRHCARSPIINREPSG